MSIEILKRIENKLDQKPGIGQIQEVVDRGIHYHEKRYHTKTPWWVKKIIAPLIVSGLIGLFALIYSS